MSNQTELSARKLSVTSLFLIAIGATSWWAITILANYSDFFYDDYRYELVTEDENLTPKGEEPFQYYESIYDPVVSPSTYLMLTGILVFAMTALWARQIANRTTAAFESTRLVKTASVWSFIAVILALVMGVIFGFATFVESLSRSEDIDISVRLLSTYVPILLTAGLLLFVVLRAFVIKPEVKMTEQQARKSLSIGFASPIIGAALGVLLGLAIFDLFNAFEEWTTVVLIALLGFSIWLGATKSGDALSYENQHGGLTAAKGAANLNSVLAIVWMVISFITSLIMGLSAVQNFREFPQDAGRFEPYNPGDFTVAFDSSVFFGEFMPAVVIVAMSMFGFVFMLVATSKVAK